MSEGTTAVAARWRRPSRNGLERALVVMTLLLAAAGVVCVDTAAAPQALANGTTVQGFFIRDAALVGLGCGAFFLLRRASLPRLGHFAAPALVLCLALLFAVRLEGEVASGGQRWLALGPLSFEPSELFTLAACTYLAVVVARTERRAGRWREVVVLTVPVAVGALLIMSEPDFGTASVLLLVVFGVLVLAGLPLKQIVLAALAGGLALGALLLLAAYRLRRLWAFFHPAAGGAAVYQVAQSKIALGSGGLTGQGLGQTPAAWGLLPNPHTDFILAVVGQEFGFIGTALVVLGLLALVTLGVLAAQRASDRLGQLLAAGITLWFALETLINVASVVGWWPVTGIPLPLISYGGTSLVIDLAALGLLANVARHGRTPVAAAAVPIAVPTASSRRAIAAPVRVARGG